MSYAGTMFIIFGLIIIFFPEIIAFLVGGFLVFIGVNILIGKYFLSRKTGGKDYVAFGKYKIYKD